MSVVSSPRLAAFNAKHRVRCAGQDFFPAGLQDCHFKHEEPNRFYFIYQLSSKDLATEGL